MDESKRVEAFEPLPTAQGLRPSAPSEPLDFGPSKEVCHDTAVKPSDATKKENGETPLENQVNDGLNHKFETSVNEVNFRNGTSATSINQGLQASTKLDVNPISTVDQASSVNQVYGQSEGAVPSAPPAPPEEPPPAGKPAEESILTLRENRVSESEDEFKNNDFSDSFTRSNFLRKVFCVILVQLVLITAVLSAIDNHQGTSLFIRNYVKLVLPSGFALYIVACIFVHFSEGPQRVLPHNITFLLMFTVAVSLILASMEAYSTGPEMYITLGTVMLVVVAQAVAALQGECAMWFGFLLSAVLCMLVFGIAFTLQFFDNWVFLFCGIIGAIVYTFVLVHTTQRIIQSKHRYSIVPKEYIFAATTVYVDAWNFFFFKAKFLRFTCQP